MRHLIAFLAGAFVAALPLVFLASPEYAPAEACHWSENWSLWPAPHASSVGSSAALTEVPCPAGLGADAPNELPWLTVAATLLACCLGGRVAGHISESMRLPVAFAATAVPYSALALLEGEVLFALVFGLVAGAFGLLGLLRLSSIAHLTNGWRATRAKPRPPQP